MKLMTHNFLSSKFLKGVVNGYPLILTATKTEICFCLFILIPRCSCTRNIRSFIDRRSSAIFACLRYTIVKKTVGISRFTVKEVDYNENFVKKILPKLDYGVLRQAAECVSEADGLPPELGAEWETDAELLRKLHRVLVSVEVVEGELKCPETGRVFPIKEGIPNMLANENEVE